MPRFTEWRQCLLVSREWEKINALEGNAAGGDTKFNDAHRSPTSVEVKFLIGSVPDLRWLPSPHNAHR